MPFSEEVMIRMSDGTQKSIKNISEGDWVIDMHGHSCQVVKKSNSTSHVVIMGLNNGTPQFKVTTDQLFWSYWPEMPYEKHAFRTHNAISATVATLKSNDNMFSNKNLVTIPVYDDSDVNLTAQVYDIKVASPTRSYFANGVIVKSELI